MGELPQAVPVGLETLADEDVVGRVRLGEHALFEILMRRYNQRVYRVARAILRDEAEAEDVTQQAWVNAYQHLAQFAGRARFSTWLTRIAIHEALARARRRGRAREVEMPEKDAGRSALRSPQPTPEQHALASELRQALEGALHTLPRTSRAVFVLREVEGLSTAEAAECLSLTEDVVKARLHRSRAHLRRELLERAGVAKSDVFTFGGWRCDRVVAAVFARLALPRPS